MKDKTYHLAYYRKNKEKFRQASRKFRDANQEKWKQWRAQWDLSDGYITQLIFNATGVRNPPAELIEAKRAHVMVKRLIRQKWSENENAG